jgi:hypothetical protein
MNKSTRTDAGCGREAEHREYLEYKREIMTCDEKSAAEEDD